MRWRNKMETCGNDKHPNGAWHKAGYEPLSTDWCARIRNWYRMKKYGCICPIKEK